MSRIEKLLDYLKDSPHDSFLQHALALEYVKEGQQREARKLFEEILERDPTYFGSYYQLAQLLEHSGETNAALRCYQRGMDAANAANNSKTYHELKAAWEELSNE
ncbi:tetratricopeptide repeat protein [Agriterribacter sp.]|uniref:tetratricopeptide repeat protein n=1 Tax=Agriterribacter sp. TaxID=2821509 RepID=UPI002C29E04C|nr:tetratricopeptide repeat protein [Agriterribacter sp.]HRO47718.1 tetratricopeptide repeat protein [Agriterribacter sp.]HRQ19427.1 tetratricopeptide repeat protein [Agriterribacter sp.]